MKKLKKIITALGIAIVSFYFKVMAQLDPIWELGFRDTQPAGAPLMEYDDKPQILMSSSPWGMVIKIAQWALIGAIFIVGIISFIRIKKTKDKKQKKKRIKIAIIVMSIMMILIAGIFVLARLLNR